MIRALLIALALLAALGRDARADRKWREKQNCAVIENPANDGDSFHVKWNTRQYIFRLLFVDTCEAENSLPERLAEQAAYFGITPEDAMRAGKMAAKFTADWLRKGPFTAYTQFDDARGRSVMKRSYAMVARGDEDLAVELVRHGLARIFGKQDVPEDMASLQIIRFRLKKAEAEAKANRAGAWGFAQSAAPGMGPPIQEQTLTLPRSVAVYSIAEPGKLLGYLTAGKTITVLRAEGAGMARVRFTTPSGQVYEELCRRADLGL